MFELFEMMANQNRKFNEEIQKSKCFDCGFFFGNTCLSKDGCTGGSEDMSDYFYDQQEDMEAEEKAEDGTDVDCQKYHQSVDDECKREMEKEYKNNNIGGKK